MASAVRAAGATPGWVSLPAEWDWTCQMPLCQLNFILDQFMPAWHQLVNGDYAKKLEGDVMEGYADLHQKTTEYRLLPSGSLFEGLHFPPYYKKGETSTSIPEDPKASGEVMVVVQGTPVGNADQEDSQSAPFSFYIDTKSCHGGYLRLHHRNNSEVGPNLVSLGAKAYLSGEKISEDYLQKLPDWIKQQAYKDLPAGESPIYEGDHKGRRSIVSDIVALECPVWPKQAAAWRNRETVSGWPSQNAKDSIIVMGCLVVPVPHLNSSPKDLEWRFDFSVAEKHLTSTLTPTQRQCYMLVKTIVDFVLRPPKVISSYCLKNVFFWCLEKIPATVWQDHIQGLAKAVLTVLDELLYCLVHSNIPHYFMPQNNLIDHVCEDFVYDLMAKSSKVRQDPLKYLFAFDRAFKFPFSFMQVDFDEAMYDVLASFREFSDNMRKFAQSQVKNLSSLITVRLKDYQFQEAVETASQSCRLQNEFQGNLTVIRMMNHYCLQCPPEVAAAGLNYLGEKIPEEAHSLLSNAACMYHVQLCKETDLAKKEQLKDKTTELFRKAMDHDDVHAPALVDYGVFLSNIDRHADAIPVLVKATEVAKPSQGNAYQGEESLTLDQRLSEEVKRSGQLQVPALPMALYLLVQCYLQAGDRALAVAVVTELCDVCKNSDNAQVHSLLGHAYSSLDQFQEAGDAFSQALKLKPDYELAEENLQLSQAMQLSKLELVG